MNVNNNNNMEKDFPDLINKEMKEKELNKEFDNIKVIKTKTKEEKEYENNNDSPSLVFTHHNSPW